MKNIPTRSLICTILALFILLTSSWLSNGQYSPAFNFQMGSSTTSTVRPWPSHDFLRTVVRNQGGVIVNNEPIKFQNFADNLQFKVLKRPKSPAKAASFEVVGLGKDESINRKDTDIFLDKHSNYDDEESVENKNQKTFSLFNNLKLPFQVSPWQKKKDNSPSEIYVQVGNALVKKKVTPAMKTALGEMDSHEHHHHKHKIKHHLHHHKGEETDEDEDEDEDEDGTEKEEEEEIKHHHHKHHHKGKGHKGKGQQQMTQMGSTDMDMGNMGMNGGDGWEGEEDGYSNFQPQFNTTRGKWIFNKGRWIFFISSKPIVNVSLLNQNTNPMNEDRGKMTRNATSPQFINNHISNTFEDDRAKWTNPYYTQSEGIKEFLTPALINASKVLESSSFHKQILDLVRHSSTDTEQRVEPYRNSPNFRDKSIEIPLRQEEFIKFKIWRLSNRTLTLENEKEIPHWILRGHKFKRGEILNLQDIPFKLKRIIMEGIKLSENHFISRKGVLNERDWVEVDPEDVHRGSFPYSTSVEVGNRGKKSGSLNYVVWNDEVDDEDLFGGGNPARSNLQKYLEVLAAQNAPLRDPEEWKRIESYLRQMALSPHSSKDDYLWRQLMQEDNGIKSNFATAMLIMSILERNKRNWNQFNFNENLNAIRENIQSQTQALQPAQTAFDPLFLGLLNSHNTTSLSPYQTQNNNNQLTSTLLNAITNNGGGTPGASSREREQMLEKALLAHVKLKGGNKGSKGSKKARKGQRKKKKKKAKTKKTWLTYFFPNLHQDYHLDFEFGGDVMEFIKHKLIFVVGLKIIPLIIIIISFIHFFPAIRQLILVKLGKDGNEWDEDLSPEYHHHYYGGAGQAGHGGIYPTSLHPASYFKKDDILDENLDLDMNTGDLTGQQPPAADSLADYSNTLYTLYNYANAPGKDLQKKQTQLGPYNSRNSWVKGFNANPNGNSYFNHGFSIGNKLGNLFSRKNKEALNVIIEDKKDAILKLLQMWNLVDKPPSQKFSKRQGFSNPSEIPELGKSKSRKMRDER